MPDNLTDLRHQIDLIDQKVVGLLNQRAAIALRAGAVKKGVAIFQPACEQQVL